MRMLVQLNFENSGGNADSISLRQLCRGYLLRDMRTALIGLGGHGGRGPRGVVNKYELTLGRAKRPNPTPSKINRIVKHLCPYLQAPVLGVESHEDRPQSSIPRNWKGPFVTFDIDPRFLGYGWAINGLLIGYLRQHVWGYQTKAHRVDIRDLRVRLAHWWEADWATNPHTTWYFGAHYVNDQRAALASVFSLISRCREPEPYMLHMLGPTHPITTFGFEMIELGLCRYMG